MALVTHIGYADMTSAQLPLLSFDITTSPDPLKASPENPDAPLETGELLIVGSRRGEPVDVESIRVKVPAGTGASDLATNLAQVNARITLDGWSMVERDGNEFVFEPTAPHTRIDRNTGFTIQLSRIPISRKVGTSLIEVTESSRENGGAFRDRTTQFSVGKFPPDFSMRNFICDPLIIDNGGDVTLTWERSANATYTLLYGECTDCDVTDVTRKEINNIRSDTTFYLIGTVGTGTESVKRILSTSVTVRKPDLEIGNLIVHGTVTAKGDVTVEAGKTLKTASIQHPATGNIAIGSTLALQGQAGVTIPQSGGQIVVHGALTAKAAPQGGQGELTSHTTLRADSLAARSDSGTLNVETNLTLGGGKVLRTDTLAPKSTGTVTVEAHVTLGDGRVLRVNEVRGRTDATSIAARSPVEFKQPVTVEQNFKLTGTSEIVGKIDAYSVARGRCATRTANTSGLLVAHVDANSSDASARIEIDTMGYQIRTNGNHAAGRPGRGCAAFAIRKGQSFTVTHVSDGGKNTNTAVWYYWIPFGSAHLPQSGMSTGDADSLTAPLVAMGDATPEGSEETEERAELPAPAHEA
ncbi:hypothetical protein [Streptomyces sp. NPDC008001]|uniref:hypothetical protein n=1 Tax=Streptomyces sp. NPDC008001 TaxID=3364804 RepID=UPI0036EC3ED9